MKISNKKIKKMRENNEDFLSEDLVEKIINNNKDKILSKINCASQAQQSQAGPLLDGNGNSIPGTVDPFCDCCT